MKRPSQLQTPAIHQEDVRAFINKMLRDHQQRCTLLTRYEGTFPFELPPMHLCSPKYYLDECLLLCKRTGAVGLDTCQARRSTIRRWAGKCKLECKSRL